jgi:ParB/RepB/Spo0J family partition protein
VLQPIVVRPLAALRGLAKYELVAGERRWLASKQAGLAHIQASVRVLTDEEVLEVQLVENLQRKGLHELEEAEGYDELMKLKKIGAEQLVAMVGKSRSYVYARLKLLALCPEARKSFYAGELDASRALLIARIGHHDTQRQALKDVTKGRYAGDEAMTYREAHRHILDHYMLALKNAPFDIKDPGLLPKAGDCIKCPKRTGNQADLFGDVKNADVCTDPKCFDDKRQAHYAVARGGSRRPGAR